MKITPVSTGTVSAGASGGPTSPLPRIPMRVNANPSSYDPNAVRTSDAPRGPLNTDPLATSPSNETNATEVTQPLSPQYTAIARQRRALQVRERAIAERERALASGSNGSSGIDVAQLKAEPLRVLLDNGVTYEQLTQAVLQAQAGGYTPEVQKLTQKIQELEQGFESKLTERDRLQEQQVLQEMSREISALAREGDEFEMIRLTRNQRAVRELIERTHRESGEVLDVPEAMRLVEAELVKDYAQTAQAAKKLQNRDPAPAFEGAAPQYQRQMRTLTSRDNATPPIDRKQRALAAFWRQQLR